MNRPITLCDRCKEYARCLLSYDGDNCRRNRTVKPTNADRIRAMSDEELAVFLYGLVNEFGSMNHDCLDFSYCKVHSGEYRYDGWLNWLKQEVAT